jgi:tRNA pseudouridine38-40 synthase
VAHLDLPVAIPPDGLQKGLNQHLPGAIRIRTIRPVRPEFHARTSARGKLYTYRLRWREPSVPWTGLRTTTTDPITRPEDFAAAVRLLPGRRDMASFTAPDATDGPTTRTLFDVRCRPRRCGLDLEFLGDGFLRYQVRRMVGALLEVARGRLSVAEFRHLLDQPRAGVHIPTAPARGLTLERVHYRDPAKLPSTGRQTATRREIPEDASAIDESASRPAKAGPVVDSQPPG